jgi:hypothetical protein
MRREVGRSTDGLVYYEKQIGSEGEDADRQSPQPESSSV